MTSSTRDLYLTKTKVKRRKRYDIITEGLKRGEGGGEMGGGGDRNTNTVILHSY